MAIPASNGSPEPSEPSGAGQQQEAHPYEGPKVGRRVNLPRECFRPGVLVGAHLACVGLTAAQADDCAGCIQDRDPSTEKSAQPEGPKKPPRWEKVPEQLKKNRIEFQDMNGKSQTSTPWTTKKELAAFNREHGRAIVDDITNQVLPLDFRQH
mmetsp:Transcript_29612/g.46412  ORF Transcript_29612/g.46412 Transcript_29612/m.46412 type:complete len:153 (-) Transcript_29612:1169-1627(-)